MSVQRPLLEAVNDVLFDQWDPIGVRSIDGNWSRDEYESYAPHLVTLVREGLSEGAIAGYLGSLEAQSMGLGASTHEHRLGVARSIRRVVEEFDRSR